MRRNLCPQSACFDVRGGLCGLFQVHDDLCGHFQLLTWPRMIDNFKYKVLYAKNAPNQADNFAIFR